jgi:hypothetical protein
MVGPRLILILAVALTVVYWSLWKFIQAGQKERLAEEWRREQPPLPEHTHVEIGLRRRAPATHRKLVIGVYVVPLTVTAVVIYLFNTA